MRFKEFRKQGMLQIFALAGILYLFIFSYIPMFGIIMGFKDYTINMGISGIFTSEWIGFKHFIDFFTDYKFSKLFWNTITLSVLKIIFTFPMPIIFAIILNEVRVLRFKRLVQTASYLPHFISWVVVSGMITTFFRQQNGLINEMLINLQLIETPLSFLTESKYFLPMAVLSDIWKSTGWWGIIFLAAIVGIDPALFEAATIDGATRIQRIFHITLPGIKPTIVVVLIMAIGGLLGGGLSGSNFEQSYLLGNPMNSDTSEIIQKYTFEVGLKQGRFAYATAVGLVQSLISVILIYVSNFVASKISDTSLF